MKRKILCFFLLLFLIQGLLVPKNTYCCSVVKISGNGVTIVGNNEDYWDPDTRIWFEPGTNGYYGSVFVGYSNLIPEGGMNEKGLMFDGLAVKSKVIKDTLYKKHIDETEFKKKIMRECSTVEEVRDLISGYNISFWSKAVWIFVDKTGRYLLVDGDSLILGDKQYCVQTNFHPSDVQNEGNIDCWRYKKAMSLLRNSYKPSIGFCTSIMDSIHWDGTRYTTVYDLKNTTVTLYFSHYYKTSITFDLKKELKKGRQVLIIPELFTENKDAYSYYKTNGRIKNLLEGLDNPVIIRDTSRISKIKKEIKNLGCPFLAQEYINNLGYGWLANKNNFNAIMLFKLNVELFPQSANAYDSLGEAYMEDKQYKPAIENYNISVKLDPGNTNGKQRIKILQELIVK